MDDTETDRSFLPVDLLLHRCPLELSNYNSSDHHARNISEHSTRHRAHRRTWPLSLPKLNQRRALTALVVRSFADLSNMRMTAKVFAQSAPQNAHTGSMNNPHARQSSQKCLVEISFYLR